MEEMFLAETLELVGAKADYVQIGDYKGADEQLMLIAANGSYSFLGPDWEHADVIAPIRDARV